MQERFLQKIGALVAVTGLAVVVTPSCVINIGPGNGKEASGEPSEESQSGQDNEPTSDLTPEELAAIEAFSKADPQEVAKASAIAGYTSYLLWGTLGAQGVDPDVITPEELSSLIEEYLPWATEEANKWIATVDATMLTIPSEPRWECKTLYGCPFQVYCDWPEEHVCMVTDCDSSKCRPCPPIFDLGSLAISSWCAYVCVGANVKGAPIVGYAAVAFSKFKNAQLGPYCVRPW